MCRRRGNVPEDGGGADWGRGESEHFGLSPVEPKTLAGLYGVRSIMGTNQLVSVHEKRKANIVLYHQSHIPLTIRYQDRLTIQA
jgi:hypothetical protein